jgi:hypothetical protein
MRSLLAEPRASPGQRAEHALDADGESEQEVARSFALGMEPQT